MNLPNSHLTTTVIMKQSSCCVFQWKVHFKKRVAICKELLTKNGDILRLQWSVVPLYLLKFLRYNIFLLLRTQTLQNDANNKNDNCNSGINNHNCSKFTHFSGATLDSDLFSFLCELCTKLEILLPASLHFNETKSAKREQHWAGAIFHTWKTVDD